MSIANNKKPTKWFYRYFISYILLVALILIIISGVVYGSFMRVFQEEIESANVSILKQMMDAIDTRISEMNRMALQISSNNSLTPFKVSTNEYTSYLTMSELQKYWAGNSFIYDIGLYYKHLNDENRIHTPNGTFQLNTFLNTAYHYADWSPEQFMEQMETLRFPEVRALENVKINNNASARFMTYMYPLPMHSTKPYGVILFLIQDRAISGITRNIMDNYNGHVYILDQKGNPIYSFAEEKSGGGAGTPSIDQVDAQTVHAPVSEIEIEGRTYSVVKLTSEVNKWTYVSIIPNEQFMMKVDSIRNVFAVTIAGIILLGIAMSLGLANRNYRPIRALVDLTGKQSRDDRQTRTDEIELIGQYLREGFKEKEGLMAKLKSKSGMVRQYLLLALLRGKTEARDSMNGIAEIDELQFDNPFFAVAVFHIDDFDQFQKNNSLAIQELFRFSICNVTEELFREVGHGHAVDLIDDRGICLLLNLKRGCGTDDIAILVQKTQEFFKQYYKFTMTVSIGSIVEDISAIHQSYLEANRASYYRFVKGKEQIIHYEHIVAEQETKYLYPKELEERLVISLKQGKQGEATSLIRQITEHIVLGMNSPERSSIAFFGIIHAILKTMDDIQIDIDDSIQSEIELLLTQNTETINLMEESLIHICGELSGVIAGRKESGNFELCNQIVHYVKAKFSDGNLSLEYIAEHFQMSPSYLTRFFKDQTGSPLMRYVDMLRMDRAKELLRTTPLTLKQVIQQIGYADEGNFIRKFKKAEGITPIQYRNLTRTAE